MLLQEFMTLFPCHEWNTTWLHWDDFKEVVNKENKDLQTNIINLRKIDPHMYALRLYLCIFFCQLNDERYNPKAKGVYKFAKYQVIYWVLVFFLRKDFETVCLEWINFLAIGDLNRCR